MPSGPRRSVTLLLMLLLVTVMLPAQRPSIQTTAAPDNAAPTRTILVGDEPFPGGIDPGTNLHYLLLVDK